MKNLDVISEELFNKIRGRFQNVTIGDEKGQITNKPSLARFFDFEYTEGEAKGKVSVSISEDEGLTVIYSDDFIANESDTVKNNWYNFLKELRVFARKRLLNFDTRNITKSNLNKRDYKFLAKNRSGEETMTESRLYGTSQTSYQDIDGARIVIKHTKPVNMEMAAGRTQHVGRIYIESSEGERFKYPYKHLNGARAMARHVAEGGNAYDDFGKHIVGLSEEMAKLRKFKNYMGRSAVMAESLAGYMDIVKERIATVKKTIESLQKPGYYKEAFESFEVPVFEDVPEELRDNWIDELTIRQFNEELKDVFPYIYKLVGEATRAKELGPEELEEYEKQKGVDGKACWKGYKRMGTKKKGGKTVDNCVKVEDQFEEALDSIMGQFSEAANDCDETCPKSCPDCGGTGDPEKYKTSKANESADGGPTPRQMSDEELADYIGASVEEVKADREHAEEVADDISRDHAEYEAKGKDLDKDGDIDSDDYMKAKDIAIKKAMAKKEKTPLPEFILSYFDRETGQFPKGETAVLTMVEKDYGEQYIEPAKQFIEMINNKVAEMYGYRETETDTELDRLRQLSGF